jgi:hypothetical protein
MELSYVMIYGIGMWLFGWVFGFLTGRDSE